MDMDMKIMKLLAVLGFLARVVLALPAPSEVPSTIPAGTVSATPTTSQVPSATPTVPLTDSNVPTSNSGSSTTRTIILVVVFVVLPTLGLYFCCLRSRLSCFGSRKEKRQYYNAAHPSQVPVYLVPVNQFVPQDTRTGYTVRVDTPANPTEMAQPVYGELHPPPRALSPEGRESGKHGGWRGLFKQ